MTLRERLLTGLRGGKPDRIPWSIYAWLLPETPAAHELHAKGLGLMGAARIFRPVYTDVAIAETRKTVDGRTYITTRIETPVGTLVQKSATESGYGTAYIRKYFISDPEDYSIADFVCKHTSFEPIFEPWYEADAQMGDGGIVIGEIMPIPILELMVAWMGTQGLAEGIYLYRDRFDALIHALDRHYDRHIEFAADCPAEIIWFPDNVTGSIISPKLFERYCAPVYARAMPIMRAAGKIPIAHYDGSNRPLLESLAQTDLPVIEAFTPPPMGDLSIAEAKEAWPNKVIWVNFPGNYFLETAQVIETYTLDLLRNGAPGGRLMIGCTEDFPVGEFQKTFSAIGRAMALYGSYEW